MERRFRYLPHFQMFLRRFFVDSFSLDAFPRPLIFETRLCARRLMRGTRACTMTNTCASVYEIVKPTYTNHRRGQSDLSTFLAC